MIQKPKLNLKPIALGIALGFASLYGVAGISSFDAGEVGVVVKQFGSSRGMQEQTYTAGTYWIDPVMYDVFNYDARRHQEEMPEVKSGTKDGQPVISDISFEIWLTHNTIPELHESVGRNYYDEIVFPAARTAIRTATGSVVSDVIYTDEGREIVRERIDTMLNEKLNERGINVLTNVRKIDFVNKQFVQLLEQKAGAAQKVIIEERNAKAAVNIAIKVANTAEGEKQKVIKEAEASKQKTVLAAEATREEMRLTGEGSKLQKEEEAKGLLAMKLAEAKGRRALADALGGEGGARIVEIEWAQNLGPNVKVYGFPTGSPGTTSVMDVNGFMDGITGKNVK